MPIAKEPLPLVEKYRLYEDSVQNHECDIEFINDEFEKHYKFKPKSLREDFGGTAAMACDWVKQGPEHIAYGVDLDSEPIAYGKENHYSRLTKTEKERMKYIQGNVLDDFDFKADVVVAFNFSYFIFKKRAELVEYFTKVRAGLSDKGAFFIDLFGGEDCGQELEEETEFDDYSYFWDCDKFNAITNETLFYIHFKTLEDNMKYERVFTYDWRLWGLAELRDILADAGFSKTFAYWEGEDDDGEGDGDFFRSEEEDNCESWVTYIMAIP